MIHNIAKTLVVACWLGCGAALASPPSSHEGGPRDDRDTLGAINNLSAEQVLTASQLVDRGKVYSLAITTGPETPAWGERDYRIDVSNSGRINPDSDVDTMTVLDDVVHSAMGVGSQIDGLAHVGNDGVHFNGHRVEDFYRPTGVLKFGIDTLPPIVGRGVMLDMAALAGKSRLAAGTAFNRKEIEAAAEAQGIELRRGDIVLFHTGWLSLLDSDPAKFLQGEPGLGLDGARYLADLGVVAVGADNSALEVLPAEDVAQASPVHTELIARRGVYILENMQTAALARDRVYEFLFVLGAPKFKGAVQAVVHPVAIR